MVNKTWNKTKAVMAVGWCDVCKKELLSDAGGWIVTATKKYFCHDGKDGSCFDNYCVLKLKKQQENNYVW